MAVRENLSEGIAVDTIREGTDLRYSIRVFTSRENLLDVTPLPVQTEGTDLNSETVIYTDGLCINNDTEEARVGSGIWYGALTRKIRQFVCQARDNQTRWQSC